MTRSSWRHYLGLVAAMGALGMAGCNTCPGRVSLSSPPQFPESLPAATFEPTIPTPKEQSPQPSEIVVPSPPDLIDDDLGPDDVTVGDTQIQRHPLEEVSDAELFERLRSDLPGLGSMSVGLPNSGRLINSVRMPEDPRWVLVDKSHAYGTQETVDYLTQAIARVNEVHLNAPPLHVGHISGPKGGFLRPHRSHQSGRDVDLGYYYRNGGQWYLVADQTSLDVELTWALVRALITLTDVRFILIDRTIQSLLRAQAESIGEDKEWLDDVFLGRKGKTSPLIRHVAGHRTHMHVRFYNPTAEETARRSYSALVKLNLVQAPTHYLMHRVKKGETLTSIAKRYGTSVRALKRANRLRSSKIIARKSYKIPRTGPASARGRVSIPARRLPPQPKALPLPPL